MKTMLVMMLTAIVSGCSFYTSELEKTSNLKIERGMPTAQDRVFSVAIGVAPSNDPSLDETIRTGIGKLLTDRDFVITHLNTPTSKFDQIRTAIDDTSIDYVLLVDSLEQSKSNSESRIVGISKNMLAKQIRVDANFNLYETSTGKIVANFTVSGSAETKRIQRIQDGNFDVSDPSAQDAVSVLVTKVSRELVNIGLITPESDPTLSYGNKNQNPTSEANDSSLIIYK